MKLYDCHLDLGGCGKRHRDSDGVLACRQRLAKAAARAAKKQAEVERRIANQEAEAPADLVARMRKAGSALVNIAAQLKRDYPPPEFREAWDPIAVMAIEPMPEWPMGRDREERFLQLWLDFSEEDAVERLPWKREPVRTPGPSPMLWPSQLVEALDRGEDEDGDQLD